MKEVFSRDELVNISKTVTQYYSEWWQTQSHGKPPSQALVWYLLYPSVYDAQGSVCKPLDANEDRHT